jgi:hypothetical protein
VKWTYLAGVAPALIGIVSATGLGAQDAGGLSATISVGQEFRYSDNLNFGVVPDSGFQSLTSLGLNVSSITAQSSFEFGLSGVLENGSDAQSGIADPRLTFAYNTGTRNTALSLRGSYREADVNDLFDDPNFIDTGLILGTGTRANTFLRGSWETGLSARFGVGANFTYQDRNFTNTVDPDLFDTTQLVLGLTARFEVSPSITLVLGYEDTDYEAEDIIMTRRDRQSLSLNGTFAVRRDLTMRAGISHDDNVTTTTLGQTTFDGIGYSLGATRELINGTVSADIDSTIDSAGRQTTLLVGRMMELRTGSLSYSFGLLKTEGDSAQPLANINYVHELPRGQFNVGFSQSGSVDSLDRNIVNTRLSAGFSQAINASSNWNAGVSLIDTNVLGVDEDTSRFDFDLSYNREVTRDWDMVVGYTHSRSTSDIAADRDSNTIFLRLQRDFEFRP